MSQMEIDSLLRQAMSADKKSQTFVTLVDKIRSLVVPNPFPGAMAKMDAKRIDIIIELFDQFARLIFKNARSFKQEHMYRGIDALLTGAVGAVCKYQITKEKDSLAEVVDIVVDSAKLCRRFVPSKQNYVACYISNIATYLIKQKQWHHAGEILDIIIQLTQDNSDLVKLFANANRQRAQCFLALNQHRTNAFKEAVLNASDPETIIFSWVCLHPPESTAFIARNISKMEKPDKFGSFFALHGDFNTLASFPAYAKFWPSLIIPDNTWLIHDNNKEIMSKIIQCQRYFRDNQFLECARQSTRILEVFPREKLTPNDMLGLFFIHYWIISSYLALGRPESGLYYAKQMRKLFVSYPFTVGLALFLELKCKLQMGKSESLRYPPEMQPDSTVTWDAVIHLHRAIHLAMQMDENCFFAFDEVRQCNNIFVKREAVHYYAVTCRAFGLDPLLQDFHSICTTSHEHEALWIYNYAIDYVSSMDLSAVWDHRQPVPTNQKLMERLHDAQCLARGFSATTRKIRQLRALLSGTSNMSKTARYITSSLSTSLDHFLPGDDQAPCKLPFPLLSIVYFDVSGLEPCLMMAMYRPMAEPFVVRIKTKDKIDNYIEEIAKIQKESSEISKDLAKEVWWTQKRNLDERLGDLLASFEKDVLGAWKGILTPLDFYPVQSPLASALLAALHTYDTDRQSRMKCEAEARTGIDLNTRVEFKGPLPLALLLGKEIHKIPWENLPCVRHYEISVTRIPSLQLIKAQAPRKRIPVVVNSRSGFYVLNPDGDLGDTENFFKPMFSNWAWDGITGKPPEESTIDAAISRRDLFVYCGHGNGNRYYDYYKMLEEKKPCKATMLLIGCSSGALSDEGDIDPTGVPYYCLASGSGTVVGNLWNVTDVEINRFLASLLQTIKKDPKLERAVNSARKACKLKYLTGAAPVVYGFPTIVQ